ncbi:MAG: NAD-dependent epimerase/dehydratase family protein [Candidatus Zixiibacteriota bacterium]
MNEGKIHAVTGAFGYTGKYIARHLLNIGCEVITLTNSPERDNSFGGKIRAYPLGFNHPEDLTNSLEAVSVLYNTYWVRFNHKLFKHADAVENTIKLFEAAKAAGVERIVHVSVTNPSEDSRLEYFRGKAVLEKALIDTGISYAILRPTLIFGREDILTNNIAWLLRKFPVFGIFGDGEYKLQPIFVDDLAKIAVESGGSRENVIIDCLGPETFTYRELVKVIASAIGVDKPILSIPPAVACFTGQLISKFKNDVIITRAEVDGLMSNLLFVESEPTGPTKFSEWVKYNASWLGQEYANELIRRKDRRMRYV